MKERLNEILKKLRREIETKSLGLETVARQLAECENHRQSLEAENKTLCEELVRERVGCMKKIRETWNVSDANPRRQLTDTIAQLEQAHSRFSEKLSELQISESGLRLERERFEEMERESQDLELQLRTKKVALQIQIRKSASLNEQIGAKRAETETIRRETDRLKAGIEEKRKSHERLSRLDEEIRRQREELEELRIAVVQAKNELDRKRQLAETIERAERVEIPQMENELGHVRAARDKARADIEDCKLRIARLNKEIPDAQSRSAESEKQKSLLSQELERAASQERRLSESLSPLQNIVRIREEELKRTEDQFGGLKKEIQVQEEALQSRKDSLSRLNDELSKLQERKRAAEENARSLKVEFEIKKKEFNALADAVKRMERDELSQKLKGLENLRHEILMQETLHRKILDETDGLEARLQVKMEERRELLVETNHIERLELPIKQEKLSQLNSEIEFAWQETKRRRKLIIETKRAISVEEVRKRELTANRDSLEKRHKGAVAKWEGMEELLSDLEREIIQKRTYLQALSLETSRLGSTTSESAREIEGIAETLSELDENISERMDVRRELEKEIVALQCRRQELSGDEPPASRGKLKEKKSDE